MRSIHGMRLAGWLAGLMIASISIAARSSFPAPQTPDSSQVAVVNGGAGPCTADFVVSDASGKGIYAAKIDIQIRYGFMGLHRLETTVKTNVEGKARIEGLPEKINKTAEFKVASADQTKSLPFDPIGNCNSHNEVVLGQK